MRIFRSEMERCFRDELLRRVQLPDQHLLRVGRQVRNRRPNIGEILPQARSPGTLALLPSEVGVVEKVFDGRAFRRISNEASLDDVDDEWVVVLGSLGRELNGVIRIHDGLDLVERVADVSEGQPAVDHVVEDAAQAPDV